MKVNRFSLRSMLAVIMIVGIVAASLATDPDWAATITGARTDMTTQLTAYGPLVIGLAVFVGGFRFVVHWIKGAMRSMRGG